MRSLLRGWAKLFPHGGEWALSLRPIYVSSSKQQALKHKVNYKFLSDNKTEIAGLPRITVRLSPFSPLTMAEITKFPSLTKCWFCFPDRFKVLTLIQAPNPLGNPGEEKQNNRISCSNGKGDPNKQTHQNTSPIYI